MDLERSVSCVGGTVNIDPASWTDNNGHGTWCANLRPGISVAICDKLERTGARHRVWWGGDFPCTLLLFHRWGARRSKQHTGWASITSQLRNGSPVHELCSASASDCWQSIRFEACASSGRKGRTSRQSYWIICRRCAGAAAAALNGRGIVGVAPKSKIAAVKVGDPDVRRSCTPRSSTLLHEPLLLCDKWWFRQMCPIAPRRSVAKTTLASLAVFGISQGSSL